MNSNLIGGQIAKFRKAAGMTQEELGRAVGVSTQAVSRWECGGAPDVALLPAVADTLHVTVDALFGREGGPPEDMEELMAKWITTLPVEGTLERIVRLMWDAAKYVAHREVVLPEIGYMDKCEMGDSRGNPMLVRTLVTLEQGFLTGIFAKDLSYFAIFPEPEEGYRAYFCGNDRYRGIFSTLAQPNCLELLLDLYTEKPRLVVPEVEARRLGIPTAEAVSLMERLAGIFLLERVELELAEARGWAYRIKADGQLIPLLYFARQLSEEHGSYYMAWMERERPWLRRAEGQQADAGRG